MKEALFCIGIPAFMILVVLATFIDVARRGMAFDPRSGRFVAIRPWSLQFVLLITCGAFVLITAAVVLSGGIAQVVRTK